jgi:hypothetical protein
MKLKKSKTVSIFDQINQIIPKCRGRGTANPFSPVQIQSEGDLGVKHSGGGCYDGSVRRERERRGEEEEVERESEKSG